MTMAVIANSPPGQYAHPNISWQGSGAWMTGRTRATPAERAELEQRARAGEWLKTGAVGKLLNMGRTKVHDLCASGEIGYRRIQGAPKRPQRECNPVDVLRLLEKGRQEFRGADTEAEAGAVEADDAS
ncbi:hypothetical protein [Melissospora conviva]|uniref:hypothetical protein n=1 Tax=Melissospora conviva TaxID=3388432 RepID=UPI003C18B74B